MKWAGERMVWSNGKWLTESEVTLNAFDPGLTVGRGAFETMVAYGGVPMAYGRHLQRLRHACEVLGMEAPNAEEIHEDLPELFIRNGLADTLRIRLRITCYFTQRGTQCLVSAIPAEIPWASASVCVSPYRRNAQGPLAGIKSTSYVENLLILEEARSKGYEEALLLNHRDEVSEGAISNLFLVKNGELHTPELASGCLPGVTRALVLLLANQAGMTVHERAISHHELFTAEELFLTNSVMEVCPVHQLENREMSTGELTTQLRSAYRDLIKLETTY